jgi:cytochrome c-type biogenesis protein CcmH/NrfG
MLVFQRRELYVSQLSLTGWPVPLPMVVVNLRFSRYLRVCSALCRALLASLLSLVPLEAQIPAVPAPGNRSFSSLSTEAAAARDANRLDDALSLYKKALALKPSWAEGWWSLGKIAYDRNSYGGRRTHSER